MLIYSTLRRQLFDQISRRNQNRIENTLACLSGAQMGSNHIKKTGDRKFCDTLPLINAHTVRNFLVDKCDSIFSNSATMDGFGVSWDFRQQHDWEEGNGGMVRRHLWFSL